MKRTLTTAAALALALIGSASVAHAQFCPSYTLSSSNNNNNCGIEAADGTPLSDAEWEPIFQLVSRGPAFWGDAGPTVDVFGEGCGKPTTRMDVSPRFPCELLKAIAMAETGWRQFCVPTTPADQVGGPERTIISFDCGYGIAQVTSGMHVGETPDFDRDRVASDPTYNMATGTRILASKWLYVQCVGDQLPDVIEHWYSATWAYNGLASSNNPNNPNYDPNRGIYDPQSGDSRPYQEKVFGRMENSGGRWDPTLVAYPNPGDIGMGSSPPDLPEPDCAGPTDCTNKRAQNISVCADAGTGGSGGAGGSSSVSSGAGGADGGAGGAPALTDDGFSEADEGCDCRAAGRGKPAGGGRAPLLLAGAALLLWRRKLRAGWPS